MSKTIKIKFFFSFCFILLILTFSFKEILACQCDESDICDAYSKAEKVFIGKLKKVEKDEKALIYTIKAHFSIEKTYKGKTEQVEVVTFKLGDCVWLDFKEGEKYFVYSNKSNINTYCSKTKFLKLAKTDIIYANSLSEKNPIYTIKGFIPQMDIKNPNLLKQIKLYLKFGATQKRIKIDKDGSFNSVVRKQGKYEILISLPFKIEVFIIRHSIDDDDHLIISNSPTSPKILYTIEFKPNQCDFSEIRIGKI